MPNTVVSAGTASLRASWHAVRGNRPFLRFLGAAGLAGLADACSAGLGFMLIDSYYGLKAAAGIVLTQWAVASMAGVWVGTRLLARHEKHRVFTLGTLTIAALLAVNSVLTPQTPHLMAFYLSLTFFHFMHVILGLVILVVLWAGMRAGRYGPQDMNGLESGAAYWHMVDLVWLILFPLVYVIH